MVNHAIPSRALTGSRSALDNEDIRPERCQGTWHHLHLIYGCVNDKDFRSILQMLPHDRTTYYYTQPSVPRALPVAQLAEAAASCGMAGLPFATVGEAIRIARAAADPRHDLVLVTGSIFLVADAVEYYSRH